MAYSPFPYSSSYSSSFRDAGEFDWFKKYADIKQHLAPLIPSKDARILMLGCGNSTLSRDMYDDGYTNILNIDVSLVESVYLSVC